jgi:hypothetical protein
VVIITFHFLEYGSVDFGSILNTVVDILMGDYSMGFEIQYSCSN